MLQMQYMIFFSPLSRTAASRFDALRLLKALSLSKGTFPGRLGDPSTSLRSWNSRRYAQDDSVLGYGTLTSERLLQ